MTDLSVTPANVIAGSDANYDTGIAGETITAGMAVYKASATGKWMKADNNAATAEARTATGISLNSASASQPISVQRSGSLTTGATMTAGVQYYLSDAVGGICPVADVGAAEYVCLVYLATSTTVAVCNFKYSAVSL